MLSKYFVRPQYVKAGVIYNTRDDAIRHAQYSADKNDETVGVYRLEQEFKRKPKPRPKPKTALRDIDDVLDDLQGHGYFGDFIYGILKQLKKDGVQTIECPVRDKH